MADDIARITLQLELEKTQLDRGIKDAEAKLSELEAKTASRSAARAQDVAKSEQALLSAKNKQIDATNKLLEAQEKLARVSAAAPQKAASQDKQANYDRQFDAARARAVQEAAIVRAAQEEKELREAQLLAAQQLAEKEREVAEQKRQAAELEKQAAAEAEKLKQSIETQKTSQAQVTAELEKQAAVQAKIATEPTPVVKATSAISGEMTQLSLEKTALEGSIQKAEQRLASLEAGAASKREDKLRDLASSEQQLLDLQNQQIDAANRLATAQANVTQTAERHAQEQAAELQKVMTWQEGRSAGLKRSGERDDANAAAVAAGREYAEVTRLVALRKQEVENTQKRIAGLEAQSTTEADKLRKSIEDQKGQLALVTNELEKQAKAAEERAAAPPVTPIAGAQKGIAQSDVIAEFEAQQAKIQELSKGISVVDEWTAKIRMSEEAVKRLTLGVTSFRDELHAIGVTDEQIEEIKNKFMELGRIMGMDEEAAQELASGMMQSLDSKAKPTVEEINRLLRQTRQETGRAGVAMADFHKRVEAMRSAGVMLRQVGMGITAISGAVFYGVQRMASGYAAAIEQAGIKNDAVAERWKAAMTRISDAQMSIGASFAEALLPTMEKGAELLEKLADFLDSHPEVVKAVAAVAGIGIVLGGITTSIGGLTALFAKASSFALKAGLTGGAAAAAGSFAAGSAATGGGTGMLFAPAAGGAAAAGGSLLAAGAAALTPAMIAAAVGGALLEGLRQVLNANRKEEDKVNWGDLPDLGRKAGAIMTFTQKVNELGDASEETKAKLWEQIKAAYGLADASDEAADKEDAMSVRRKNAQADTVMQEYNAASLSIQRSYTAERLDIELDLRTQLTAIAAATAKQLAAIQKRYEETVANLTENYEEQEADAREDYLKQATKIEQQLHKDIVRIKKNNAKQLEELEYQHNLRVYDLAAERDALGLAEENERYAHERDKLKDEGNEQIKDRKEQTQEQLDDLKASYEEQRAQRWEQYQEQLADAAAAYEEQKAQVEEQKAEAEEQARVQAEQRYQQSEDNFVKEMAQLANQTNAKLIAIGIDEQRMRDERSKFANFMLSDLDIFLDGQRTRWNTFYQDMNLLSNPTGGPPVGGGSSQTTPGWWNNFGYASGGYVGNGVYRVGEQGEEFVMNNTLTRAAEGALGGRLTQEKMMMALANGGSRKSNVNITLQSRSLSVREIQQEVSNAMDKRLTSLVGAFGVG